MSTPRLPIPGEDSGNWGEILNEYLLVAHNNDGTLKAESIIVGKANNSEVVHNTGSETVGGQKTFSVNPIVPTPSLPLHAANKSYVDSTITGKANTADLAAVATSGSFNDLTDVPAGSDFSSLVTLADIQTISGQKNFTGGLQVAGNAVVATNDARLSDTRTPTDNTVATAKLQDGSVTEPKLAISNSPGTGNVLGWDGSSLKWDAPASAPVSSVNTRTGAITLDKTDVGLANADNTSDANKPVSTATQTALDLKANTADLSQVATTGSYNDLTNKPTIADDANAVHLDGTQTITGEKNFTGGLKVGGTSLATVATTGSYSNLLDKPTLSTVAASGAYGDLSGKPSLSTVATSGSYDDLTNKPTIPTGGTGSSNYAVGDDSRITGAIQKSVATAKGDIIVATGSGAVTHLGVGGNNQVLTADSGQASGLKWADAASSGIVRHVENASSNFTAGSAAATDYVYSITSTCTVTLPTAIGNTNRYTITFVGSSGAVTIETSLGQTINGSSTISYNTQYTSYDLISDGSNWIIR